MANEFPLEKRVAIVCDFDLTLTEQYMQIPLFEAYFDNIKDAYKGTKDKNGNVIKFEHPSDYFKIVDSWAEPNNGVAYVTQILTDIRLGVFPELTNEDLKQFGSKIELAPGLPAFFSRMKKKWENQCDIKFYIISVGFEEMIKGSAIAEHVDGIYGTKLVSRLHKLGKIDKPILDGVANIMTPFSKTKSIIEIAKGGKENIDKLMGSEEYELDYRNIITIGDGLSDVSQFAYLTNKGSLSICVYKIEDKQAFDRIMGNETVRDRVSALLQRDYRSNSMMNQYINKNIYRIIHKECNFDQSVLNREKKNKINDPKLRKVVKDHLETCSECNGLYSLAWEPPR
jgi:2-hydroxy-3-keto-5-methylthiopentenyl-1-phosphate phosphatase